MPELLAQGPTPADQWRRPLPDRPVTLGRRADKSDLDVPWDRQVSGLHAELTWRDGRLTVRRLPSGKNQIFYRGEPADQFTIGPGDQFVIGDTTFVLADAAQPDAEPPRPHTELSLTADQLHAHRFVDADERIEVLATLPAVIRFSPSETELEKQVVAVLLKGIPRASAAAVVRLAEGVDVPEVRAAKGAGAGEFRPSRRLTADALRRRKQPVLHVWHGGELRGGDYTADAGHDWALCVPLPEGPGTSGWGVYVTGRLSLAAGPAKLREDLLKSDLKFAELVAEIFASLRHVFDLQGRLSKLRDFLPRPVVTALAARPPSEIDEVLKPREALVTVLFCDIRNSCRIHEAGRADLMALWARIKEALSIMSGAILEHGGVVADFQGDAAMGFWGWPLEVPDQIERAAQAALAIIGRFARVAADSPLGGIAAGLGMAHGPAVAGRLGTAEQPKIDVFGPTVNLASRLEGLSKKFGVSILADEDCGRRLSGDVGKGWVRVRRLARVQPYGMAERLTVSEVLPPEGEPGALAEAARLSYERALEHFVSGDWAAARSMLGGLAADGAATFLAARMEHLGGAPPAGWDGVVVLESK